MEIGEKIRDRKIEIQRSLQGDKNFWQSTWVTHAYPQESLCFLFSSSIFTYSLRSLTMLFFFSFSLSLLFFIPVSIEFSLPAQGKRKVTFYYEYCSPWHNKEIPTLEFEERWKRIVKWTDWIERKIKLSRDQFTHLPEGRRNHKSGNRPNKISSPLFHRVETLILQVFRHTASSVVVDHG